MIKREITVTIKTSKCGQYCMPSCIGFIKTWFSGHDDYSYCCLDPKQQPFNKKDHKFIRKNFCKKITDLQDEVW